MPKIEKLKILPNTARALKSDAKCKRYMGISLNLFEQIMSGMVIQSAKFKMGTHQSNWRYIVNIFLVKNTTNPLCLFFSHTLEAVFTMNCSRDWSIKNWKGSKFEYT